MSNESRMLMFEGMSQPVRLQGCDEVQSHLPLVFPGWKIDNVAATDVAPVLNLSRDGSAYRLEGYWLAEPLRRIDDVDAVCALVAEVMRAHVRQDESRLCLHGAAVEFNGRLVVFPSRYRAGKSLLSACLAAAGSRLFCDDILPLGLDRGEGIAPGLAPRLRVPLPETLDRESREFIESRIRLRNERYCYLDLDADAMAARGERLPIGAFVLLEREEGASAELEAVGEAEVLAQVVWQNFAREAEAPTILEVLNRLVAGAKRYRLRYDRPADAVRLLRQAFDRWPGESAAPSGRIDNAAAPDAARAGLASGQYRQNPEISMVRVDDSCFLADRQGAAIHQLNPIGSSIWGLLAEPMTPAEITELLHNAFPELDRAQLRDDIGRLLNELTRKNLLRSGNG